MHRLKAFVSILVLFFLSCAFLHTPPSAAQDAKDTATKPVAAEQQAASSTQTEAPPETPPLEVTRTPKHLRLAWDNTLKYSNAFRLAHQNPILVDAARNPSNLNQDDGDRNFHGGLVSDRADLLSEMDLTYGSWGMRASMAMWLDEFYNRRNANNSPYTNNNITTDYRHYVSGTQGVHFRNAELLDAFAFGKFSVGSGSLSIRGGQYAQFWGETLFFGSNGIAGGMAPIDIVKAQSVPFTQFKELIRPVPQVGIEYQLNPRVAIGAYYQLGWEEHRLPSAGSYFSESDILGNGGEMLIAGPLTDPETGQIVIDPVTGHPAWVAFTRTRDVHAKNWGQGGVEFKLRPGHGYDIGFYAIQYHEKAPQLYLEPIILGNPTPLPPNYGGVIPNLRIGDYNWVYPENIKTYGLSATKTTGIVNWAAEISGRTNTDLVSDGQAIVPGHGGHLVFNQYGAPTAFVITADNNKNPLYAVGSSFHANVSALATFGPSFISREASLLGEVAWNRLLSISKNPEALDPNTTRDAVGFQLVYTPTYRQVRSGLDLSPTVGLSFYPMGKSAVIGSFGPDQGGTWSVGMTAAYMDHWRVGVSYNRYYGSPAGFLDASQHYTFGQSYSDRNFISFSIYRTFGLRAEGGKTQLH